jgi:hypothetical protein
MAFYTALFVAMISIYKQDHIDRIEHNILWPAFIVVLSITYGFIASILGYAFAFLISITFKDVIYTPIGTSFLIALFCGFLAYQVAESIFQLGQREYLRLTLGTFIIGFFTAAVMTNDQHWWQGSICALGMPANEAYGYYNFTLILVGALLMVFAIYLQPQIKSLISKGILDEFRAKLLAVLYFIETVTIALVGAVPYGLSNWLNILHVLLGYYIFINIGVIILFSFWLFQKFPRYFLIVSYLLMLVGLTFYLLGSKMDLTTFALTEISTAIIVVVWVVVFLRALEILNGAPRISVRDKFRRNNKKKDFTN